MKLNVQLQFNAQCCLLVAVISTLGCDRSQRSVAMKMSTEQVIKQYADTPVGQSIAPVVHSLASGAVFVATGDATITEPTKVKLEKLQFKTALDNQGRLWAYAYTSEAAFLQAFPPGEGFAELSFAGFFAIIDGDSRFAGIVLNGDSDAFYPIPRELFDDVKQALQGATGE